jgi:3-hexulose-6-phosphate synthase/6-phospho-3-hexuloisomerase
MIDIVPKAGGPIIQVAIDTLTIAEALEVAERALRAGVDWLEAGTPLITFEGVKAIGALSQAFPDVPLLADFKMMDGVRKYVLATAEQGGHLATICGVAADASIRAAVKAGQDSDTRVVVDLYAARDMVKRAVEVEAMGVDVVYVHFGADQRAEDPSQDTLGLIPAVKKSVNVPVGASTFDVEGGAIAVKAGADIVVIGHPLITGPDSQAMLTEYVRQARAAFVEARGDVGI